MIKQTQHLCYIALGSNQNQPIKQVLQALQALNELSGCRLSKYSSLYSSPFLGNKHLPDVINAVSQLSTQLSPHALLKTLQSIERKQGRLATNQRWQSRTLDLDLLLYDNQVIEDKLLTIPHPEMHKRAFVLTPLSEINPQLILPNGEALQTLIERCPPTPLRCIKRFEDIELVSPEKGLFHDRLFKDDAQIN